MTEAEWTGPSLREVANTLRTKPTPLSALIPQLQRAADKIDAQAAEIEALRADAERYRWLRHRLKVREEKSLAGSYRDSIYVRVGQSFFDTPTRGVKGYVEPAEYEKECAELDAAIDAARQS